LGTRPGAARRAIVSLAGTEHKTPTMGCRVVRRPNELDVVDLLSACARDPIPLECLPNPPGEVGQLFDMGKVQSLPMTADEVEPVASPGYIAGNGADALGLDPDILGVAVA